MPKDLPDKIQKVKWKKAAKDVETWEHWYGRYIYAIKIKCNNPENKMQYTFSKCRQPSTLIKSTVLTTGKTIFYKIKCKIVCDVAKSELLPSAKMLRKKIKGVASRKIVESTHRSPPP